MTAVPITSQTMFMYMVRALVMLTALPLHEFAHSFVADKLGDHTARSYGRLTLNPLVHLDIFGSLLLIFAGFGWAKPVPVDSRNFKSPRQGMAITALAGPMSNVLFAAFLIIVYKLIAVFLGSNPDIVHYSSNLIALVDILYIMVYTNLYLAVFNLLPIPPLDGSRIFSALLPGRYYAFAMKNERYIYFLLVVLVFTGSLSGPIRFLADGLFWFLDTVTIPIQQWLG